MTLSLTLPQLALLTLVILGLACTFLGWQLRALLGDVRTAKVKADCASLAEDAWGLIANAGGGDWGKEGKDWEEAAKRWLMAYGEMVMKECEDCGIPITDLATKGDHHGGLKTVCKDRGACHRRSPG